MASQNLYDLRPDIDEAADKAELAATIDRVLGDYARHQTEKRHVRQPPQMLGDDLLPAAPVALMRAALELIADLAERAPPQSVTEARKRLERIAKAAHAAQPRRD